MSSIDVLPTELLADIFLFSSNTSISVPPKSKDFFYTAPWTLRRVNSRWRSIALSEPRLWRDIVVTFPTQRTAGSKIRAVVHAVLTSTSSVSLSLASSESVPHHSPHADLLVSIVKPLLPRLEKLHLDMPALTLPALRRVLAVALDHQTNKTKNNACVDPSPLAAIRDLAFPLLLVSDTWSKVEALRHLRGLRRLSLASGTFDSAMHTFFQHTSDLLPWECLTHLSLVTPHALDPKHLQNILTPCVSLECLTLNARLSPCQEDENTSTPFPSQFLLPPLMDLHTLHIVGGAPLRPTSSISVSLTTCHLIPWNQIHTLSLHTLSPLSHILPVLRSASPSLCVLSLSIFASSEPTPVWLRSSLTRDILDAYDDIRHNEGAVTLPNLHTLTVSRIDVWALRALRVPSLTELHVPTTTGTVYNYDDVSLPAAEILDLLCRSSFPCLKVLTSSPVPLQFSSIPTHLKTLLPYPLPTPNAGPPALDDLLHILSPSLYTLCAPMLYLPPATLSLITHGSLLSCLQTLVAHVPHDLRETVRLAEARGGFPGVGEDVGTLIRLWGYYASPSPSVYGLDYERGLQNMARDEVINQLEKMNTTIGTDFRVIPLGYEEEQRREDICVCM